jgi:hypothetical protein
MHPVGPRSARVYWVRRTLVAALAVVVVIGVVWYVVGRARGPQVDPAAETVSTSGSNEMTGVLATDSSTVLSGGGDGKSGGTASSHPGSGHSAATATGTKSSATKATGTRATGTRATGTKATGTKASGTKASGTKATGTKATGTKVTATKATGAKATGATSPRTTPKTTPTTTPKTNAPTPKTTPPPPPSYDDQGRLLCADSTIALRATTGAPSYRLGSQPILGLVVTNTSDQACVRDLSGTLQVFTVFNAAGTRMWSTADCFPGEGTDVRQLAAGQAVTYNIKWSGTTSNPGCTAERKPVPAGKYTLIAQLGALRSPATPFTITG